MEQKIINYLTTIVLSILYPTAWWATIEMHSNSPPKFPITMGEWANAKRAPCECAVKNRLSLCFLNSSAEKYTKFHNPCVL